MRCFGCFKRFDEKNWTNLLSKHLPLLQNHPLPAAARPHPLPKPTTPIHKSLSPLIIIIIIIIRNS